MYRLEIASSNEAWPYDESDFDDDRRLDVVLWVKDRLVHMKPGEEMTITKL